MLDLHALHRRAARVLPAALRTSGVLLPPMPQERLIALLLPLRHRAGGVIRFRLGTATAAAMRQAPEQWFSGTTRAREGLGRHAAALAYGAWRSVRLAPLAAAAITGDRQSGSESGSNAYFTRSVDGRALLLVIPAQRLAVYAWRDRGRGRASETLASGNFEP